MIEDIDQEGAWWVSFYPISQELLSKILIILHENTEFLKSIKLFQAASKSSLLIPSHTLLLSLSMGWDKFLILSMDFHLLFLVYLLYFLIGPSYELGEFIFTEYSLYVFVVVGYGFAGDNTLPCVLIGYLLVIVILEAIKDMRPTREVVFLMMLGETKV